MTTLEWGQRELLGGDCLHVFWKEETVFCSPYTRGSWESALALGKDRLLPATGDLSVGTSSPGNENPEATGGPQGCAGRAGSWPGRGRQCWWGVAKAWVWLGAWWWAWLKDPGDTHHFLQFIHLPELVVVRPEPGFSCQVSGKANLVGLGLGFADPWDHCCGSGPFPGSSFKVQGPQEGSKEL